MIFIIPSISRSFFLFAESNLNKRKSLFEFEQRKRAEKPRCKYIRSVNFHRTFENLNMIITRLKLIRISYSNEYPIEFFNEILYRKTSGEY